MNKAEIPRNPGAYSPDPKGHFRRKKDEREVPSEAIRQCIENGEIEEQDNGRVKCVAEYLGYKFAVVLDPEEMYAVTTYPIDSWN